MSNLKKFFNKNCLDDSCEKDIFFMSKQNNDIEIKLIKLKSQGLISGYYYNFYRNLWEIKGNNGVSCECCLDNDIFCFGDVKFVYKTQILRKYFEQPVMLVDAICSVFTELEELYIEELEERAEQENKNIDLRLADIAMGVVDNIAVA